MNLTDTWLQSAWMKALGWTFVHSIWQIAVIGLLLYIILRVVPGRSAHTRYTISTLALWTTLVTALCTFMVMLPQQQNITEVTGRIILVQTSGSASISNQLSAWLETRMPMMLIIWWGGVSILMLRLAISLGWVSHLRYESLPQVQLQTTLNEIIHRLQIKSSPVVAESLHIKSPITIGNLKPLILFPVGIINQLSPNEVEAILTHELAHIVRRDYLSNLIQSFIETLFYYHPVTWWISRMVRTERENRADDLALSWCGDHLAYAKALMTIQEMQVQHVPHLAVGFASGKGAMLARIQRILQLPYKNHNQMEKAVLLSLCALCFLAFTLSGKANDNRKEKTPADLLTTSWSETVQDSIPTSGTYKIHKKTEKEDISIEVQNGDIKELKIDGKAIEPEQYDQYNGVIDELFGSMAAPPAFEEFDMPDLPGLPALPPLPEMEGLTFVMPPMPPMTPMPPMPDMSHMAELERALGDQHIQWLGEGNNIAILNDDGSQRFQYEVITDSVPGGQTRIIIINGSDSVQVCSPKIAWSGEMPGTIAFDAQMMNDEEWQKWAEEWKKNSENWSKEWKQQADQWKEQSKQWKEKNGEEWKAQAEQWRAEQERWRENQEDWKKQQKEWKEQDHNFMYQYDSDRARDEALRELENQGDPHDFFFTPSPRTSLSDELVNDGLIEPGEEAQIQLTPDKLKINGHKMSDELHAKYLKLYERQQGVELSGNSRVEFTTKSRQRM